jgi:hypothetical protein
MVRITGNTLETLRAIHEQEIQDEADYTDRVKEIVWGL